ncbi:hypothetical protein [Streptosporangium amethystogenes]|uniref:hypothetical protein n=1 Tax=Streptosporangium amethystogenes TaxID=2002 RepID=UPI0012FBAAA1|nr:hypothetical protein [Streptosporangium amethystogenes]
MIRIIWIENKNSDQIEGSSKSQNEEQLRKQADRLVREGRALTREIVAGLSLIVITWVVWIVHDWWKWPTLVTLVVLFAMLMRLLSFRVWQPIKAKKLEKKIDKIAKCVDFEQNNY